MRTLLIHPSALMYSEIFLRLEPLGVERVAEAARSGGHDVRVVDLQVLNHDQLTKEMRAWRPEAVGFGVNYLANVPEVIDRPSASRRCCRTASSSSAATAFHSSPSTCSSRPTARSTRSYAGKAR